MGCGVAAGMYQAKHNTEGTEDWRKLPPSQQVKHWKLYVFLRGHGRVKGGRKREKKEEYILSSSALSC